MARFTRNTRLHSLAAASLCSLVMIGCLNAPEENAAAEGSARLSLDIRPGVVSASSLNRPEKVVVTLTSVAGDTLRDTITAAGSRLSEFPVKLDAAPGAALSVAPLYVLNPQHAWKVTVKTLSARGTIVHLDSTGDLSVEAHSIRNVTLRPASRFAAYEAAFSLPGTLAKGASLSKVELAVDGETACASSVQGATALLTCDDLPAGNHTVTLRAYGVTDGATGLLFKGDNEININAAAATEIVTLAAGQDGMGALGMSVRLGRVGHVVMNVEMSGGVAL